MITVDRNGKKVFMAFYCINNDFYIKLDIISKVLTPYITITLVRKMEGCSEVDIDNYPNYFAIYEEILLYSKYDLSIVESLCIMCAIPTIDTKYLNLKTELFFENSISEKIENEIQIL